MRFSALLPLLAALGLAGLLIASSRPVPSGVGERANAPALAVSPAAAAAQDLDVYRRHIEYLSGDESVWRTPSGASQGADTFAMAYTAIRGGAGATGCLWGEADGAVLAVYWEFLQAWDPVKGRAFVYQASPLGDFGVGEETRRDGPVGESVQTFVWADGSRLEQMHETTEVAPDTLRTRSLNRVDGEWVPNRTFTWIRSSETPAPC